MSDQLEIIKSLAAKAQAAHAFELKPILMALVAAMIYWMEKQEEEKNGKS